MPENIKTWENSGSLLQRLTPRIFNDHLNLLVGLGGILCLNSGHWQYLPAEMGKSEVFTSQVKSLVKSSHLKNSQVKKWLYILIGLLLIGSTLKYFFLLASISLASFSKTRIRRIKNVIISIFFTWLVTWLWKPSTSQVKSSFQKSSQVKKWLDLPISVFSDVAEKNINITMQRKSSQNSPVNSRSMLINNARKSWIIICSKDEMAVLVADK
jgi:hypothetical protein